jgi:hypothetical protein
MHKLSSFFRPHRKKIISVLIMSGFVGLMLATVKVNITGDHEGIFLLKGKGGAVLEVRDDLFLGEEDRYIAGIDLEREKDFLSGLFDAHATTPTTLSTLSYEWNSKRGEGFVRDRLPGGRQLLTTFSRFIDDGGREAAGLFVGGGLPSVVRDNDVVKRNETGMAYYDGLQWHHIWCNSNEAISNARNETVYPSAWKFLGSRILHGNTEELFIESSHEITVDGVPLHMTRTAVFKAGKTYFVLTVRIKNMGDRPATYTYLYGDDPWVGHYGTSAGNVGWSSDGVSENLYLYKGRLNTKKLHYAGLFDFGNDVIGEGHEFTRTANFIEWFGDIEPAVFFSNGPSDLPQVNEKQVPLSSNRRFMGIQWGPRTLNPGQTETYTLAIGMAVHNPKDGFPMKPDVDLKNFP